MTRLFLVLTALLCTAATPVNSDVCIRVLLRALSFDRNLEQRVGHEAVLMVAYNSRDAHSMEALDVSRAERARLADTRLGGAVIRIVEVDLRAMDDWSLVVIEHDPDAVILLPGTQPWTESIAWMPDARYITLGQGWDAEGRRSAERTRAP